MLTFFLSFHQVMARFLDMVLSFGKTSLPFDFHYTAFREESCSHMNETEHSAIPRLGRSARQVRICYNLWSVELSDARAGPPWSMRQTAVYHSFDIENGRALWITIKANDLLQKRVTEASKTFKQLQPSSIQNLQGSFSSTLITHLLYVEWCDEN